MNLMPTSRQPALRRQLLARLMRLANANSAGPWYQWKDILLATYAEGDGFDSQRYEAPCWHCDSNGWVGDSDSGYECDHCNDGVHHITRTLLSRHSIDGHVFHRPMQTLANDESLSYAEESPQFRRRITGLVKHRETSWEASREAEAWILLITGSYRSLWRWLNGAGASLAGPGLPMNTVQWLLHQPDRLRMAWRKWKFRRDDIPF